MMSNSQQKTLDQCIEEIFKTVKPHPHLQWRIWKIRFKKKKLSLKIKEKMLRKYGYEKIEDAHYGLKPKEYEWVKLDNVDIPTDIWMKESEIEPLKSYLAEGDFREFNMWFKEKGETPEQTKIAQEKYIEENKSEIPIERILSFTAAMYGNKPERAISIIRDNEVIEVWERRLKK